MSSRYTTARGYDFWRGAAMIRRAESDGDQVSLYGGQEMNTGRQLRKHLRIIATLLMLTLFSTGMTGCRSPGTVEWTSQSTSDTVNNAFVDVDGFLVAPTKVVTSYPTEELNLGNDAYAGGPQFVDGALYTFTYRDGHEDVWVTAWDQATGRKLWSADTGLTWIYSSVSDGKHLFLHTDNTFCCLDGKTGTTVWKNTLTAVSPFAFDLSGQMVLHINKQDNVADRLYVLGAEMKKLDSGSEQRNPGIYILDGADGKLLGRIDWPALTLSNGGGELLCDGPALYASIPESTKADYPAQTSSLVAFDLTTNKVMWQERVDGEGSNLVKQTSILIFVRSASYSDRWIDVWQINAHGATRLWTRQADATPEEGLITSFAVDNTYVYLQGSKGVFRALSLWSGQETWKHQFAPTKGPITDGPDVGKLHDTYPTMTLTPAREVLYVQDGGGLVTAFDPMGNELWSKRIANIQIGQTSARGLFVFQPVDKGFLVIASDGKVDVWK
ncbi:MAG: outer membrane protein assembly factor BamB family protein [Candidatus Cryosericum sp.]